MGVEFATNLRRDFNDEDVEVVLRLMSIPIAFSNPLNTVILCIPRDGYCFLSEYTLKKLVRVARTRVLRESDCIGFFAGLQAHMMRTFDLGPSVAKSIMNIS